MGRPTFAEFKRKALTDPSVKEEYEALSSAYKLRKKLIALRQQAGLTQEKIANALHTQKSNISCLENASSTRSPKLSTIEQYASAVGYEVEINFVPKKTYNKKNTVDPKTWHLLCGKFVTIHLSPARHGRVSRECRDE